jgi:imidazolonepropionase
MEHAHEEAVAALARAGVTAVLLPIASFTLADKAPDVALFRKYGLPMAVASDANPGTAPTESLPLALAFAVRNYGLTPDEVWQGVTRRSAHCLGESLRGSLQAGSLADFVVWDLPHELALLQPWGTAKAHRVVREGRFLLP